MTLVPHSSRESKMVEQFPTFDHNPLPIFDIMSSSNGLTEEFLYSHQPVTNKKLVVYSTSSIPIGYLDDTEEIRSQFTTISGPVVIVARKGYAGRLTFVNEGNLIIHEDAYAIKPKKDFLDYVNLEWFAFHYNEEFQSYRTSPSGIGDFPRERFRKMKIIIPNTDFQSNMLSFYLKRQFIIQDVNEYKNSVQNSFIQILGKYT